MICFENAGHHLKLVSRRRENATSQTERLYWIDAQIRDGHYPNAQRVRDHFGVSLRTAYRDRDYLLYRLDAPLKFDDEHGGWTYTHATFVLPYLALSDRQASALRRSLLAAQEYLGPADAEPLRLVCDRRMPDGAATLVTESIGGSMHFTEAAHVGEDLLDACRRAVRNRQKMQLIYYGAHRNETASRVVQPYQVYYFQGEPHLIAWCERKQDFRQFFLGRVKAWESLEPDGAFIRDSSLDADVYLRRGLGLQPGAPSLKVRVSFSAYQSRWIRERQYRSSQRLEEKPEGGVIMTLHMSGMEEVQRWIMPFGGEAEVLEARPESRLPKC